MIQKQYNIIGIDTLDLYQEGLIGLLHAINTFDKEKDVLFYTYANICIRRKIIKIRRTVQDTIPYYAVYPNGVIEIEPGVFSRLYEINDANFRVATDEEQENMFEIYRNFLNSFDANTSISVTINNRNIDEADFLEDSLIKENDDGMDEFREEYNDMLKEKIAEGKNNLHNEKYLTVTIKAPNIDKATSEFDKLDMEISKNIKRITDVDTEPISTKKTLEILHDIYNLGHEGEFDRERTVFGKKVYSYNLEALKPSGLKILLVHQILGFIKIILSVVILMVVLCIYKLFQID